MKKLLFPLFFFPLVLNAADIQRGVYVEDPTLTSAIFKLRTTAPSPVWLEYGPAPACNQIMALSPEGYNHAVLVQGLVPNKDFCYNAYVLNANRTGVQPPLSGRFRTLFTPERKQVNFIVFGNTAGSNAEGRTLLADKLSAETPDFFIHTGDLVSTGLDTEADAEFFLPFRNLLLNAPMFIAVGEKEYGEAKDAATSSMVFRSNFAKSHTMTWGAGSPEYYSFDTANARFIFLSTAVVEGVEGAPSFAKDSKQYAWFKKTLATTDPGMWKIVVLHNPVRSTGVSGQENQNLSPDLRQAQEDLVSLMEMYGVNLVIQGHDQAYERTFTLRKNKDTDQEEESERGIVYITLGTGASETLTKRALDKPWTARFVSSQAYAVMEIVDRRLSVKVYNFDGKILDTVDIAYS